MERLLATPLRVFVLFVGKHVPQLSFQNILRGTDPIVEPGKHVYQQLLAGDQQETAVFVEKRLMHDSLVNVYDTVLVSTLSKADTHWQLRELNEGQHTFIMRSLKETTVWKACRR